MTKERITYRIPNTPQGAPAIKTVDVDERREDGDWTYFTCSDGSKLGFPTRWIQEESS